MNEQIERLAGDLLQIAQAAQRRANPHRIDSAETELGLSLRLGLMLRDNPNSVSFDDIKAALKLATKKINQIQHREEQKRAAAERAASAAEIAREEKAGERERAAFHAPLDPNLDVVPLPELDQYFR